MRAELIKLAGEGYGQKDISKLVGISLPTLSIWRKRYKDLKELMDKAEKQEALGSLKRNIRKLSEGSEVYEETSSFYEKEENKDGSERLIKRTIKRKVLPPDIGALKMLASKYAKGEYVDNKEEEINVNIRITQKDRALTLEERQRILEHDKNQGSIVELTDSDYKLIDELEGKDG